MTRALPIVLALLLAATACTGATAKPRAPTSTPAATPTSPSTTTPTTVTPPTTPTTTRPTLASTLDAVLSNTNSCLLVTDGTSGGVLYSHRPDDALTPASSQKLLVAAAALDRLGPDYRFSTTVVAAGSPVGGAVDALWLVGGGDPLLATPEYATALQAGRATMRYPTTPVTSLAVQLAAKGVKLVRNGIHGDDTRYERLRYLPTWAPTINHGEFDVGPLGALEVDQGLDRWRPAVPSADPAEHSAAVLAQLLGGQGVVAAQADDQAAPAGGIILASVVSAPLSEIIGAMLRASDNQIAELLVRELDHRAGRPGTTAGGVREVMAAMGRLGLPVAGLSLVDGSGLSRSNHVSCRTLLAALGLGDQARLSGLSAGLPVAGVSGTMAGLFVGTPLAGRLAAKGGYITGVTALVGRLSGPNPRRFALVVNGSFSFADGLSMSERVAETIAVVGSGAR